MSASEPTLPSGIRFVMLVPKLSRVATATVEGAENEEQDQERAEAIHGRAADGLDGNRRASSSGVKRVSVSTR